MKILFITHYTQFYGANQSLRILLDSFKNKGVDVHLLTPFAGAITEYCKQNAISYHIREFKPAFISEQSSKFKRVNHFIQNFKYYPRLIKLISKLKPDIIYSNTSVIDIGFFLSKLLKIKHVWHIREFGDKDYGVRYALGNKSFLRKIKKTNSVICISEAIQNEVVKNSINSIIIYNGVISNESLKLRIPQYYPKNKFVFAMVGLLFPKKGHLSALNAFKEVVQKHPIVAFYIYGTGEPEYTDELKRYVIENNLSESVVFRGFEDNKDLIYADVNCLLMCSDYEGFGRVTVEAMAYGIPVIGKNSGGTPEIITNNYNGYLYVTNEQFSGAMKEIITSKDNYEKLSKNALETARKFTIEQYSQKVYMLLKDL